MIFQERTYSVLIVTATDSFTEKIMPLLPVTDYWPVTVVRSIGEARRKISETAFDIVLINAPLPDDFGMRLAVDICTGSGAGVLLLVRNDQFDDIYARVVSYGVLTLSKPTSMQMVAQNLRILCATRERMRQMEAKQATVEEKIEEIRLVNRAKWLLIQQEGISEADAQHRLEKQAMDNRVSKKQVAEEIIKIYA